MPDYPYVFDAGAARPIGQGGTRLRLFRRRPAPGEQEGGAEERGGEHRPQDGDSRWRELLQQAVDDLNASFERRGVPFSCALDEDALGFSLRVTRISPSGEDALPDTPLEEVEEVVDAADLPGLLNRLHARLGILVDEKA